MKISIIGAGNAGCFTALQLADFAKDVGLELVIEISDINTVLSVKFRYGGR